MIFCRYSNNGAEVVLEIPVNDPFPVLKMVEKHFPETPEVKEARNARYLAMMQDKEKRTK